MDKISSVRTSRGVYFMILSIISLSVMQLCVKLLPRMPVSEIILFRSAFSLVICLIQSSGKDLNLLGNDKKGLLIRGFAGTLGLVFFFHSIKSLPLATAISISNLIPLFTLLLASVFLKEAVSVYQWLFFLISFLGVVVIKGFDPRVSLIELMIAISAAFFAGLAHFMVRKLRNTDHVNIIILYLPLVSIPCMLPFAISDWVQPVGYEWLSLILVGLLTHIGQVFLTKAYQLEEINRVSNIYFLGIALSIVFGYIFFQETYNLQCIIGIALISTGIFLNIQYKNKTA